MIYKNLPGYLSASDADRAEIDRFAARLMTRDVQRCFRCGDRLTPMHDCRPCPVDGCARDLDHEGDHGTGIYARDGAFVADPPRYLEGKP